VETPREHHGNTVETPREHRVNTTRTPWKHHANTVETPREHRGNTTRTPCKHHANTMETPREHHGNTTRTPWKHHANTTRTPREHRGNTMRTPCEHRGNTMRTPPRRQFGIRNSVGNNSNKLQKVFSPEGVPAEGVLSRRCSLQKVFSPEGVLSRRCSLQKVFSAQLWYRICVDTNRSPKPKFLNCGLGKLDPRPSLRTSVDNLQNWGTKTYLCFGNQFQSTTPFTTYFTT
jgi:hypothetical protein